MSSSSNSCRAGRKPVIRCYQGLQQERDIQAHKALAVKKKLKHVDGAADEDIK